MCQLCIQKETYNASAGGLVLSISEEQGALFQLNFLESLQSLFICLSKQLDGLTHHTETSDYFQFWQHKGLLAFV